MKSTNNPMNIRHSQFNHWKGQVGVTRRGFCIFDTPDNGIRAGIKILRTYIKVYNLVYPRQILQRYAPSFENDVEAYLHYVVSFGIREDAPIVFGSREFILLVIAMCYYESNYRVSFKRVADIIYSNNLNSIKL